MAHKSRDAVEAGRALCDRWARDFDLRTMGSRDLMVIRSQLQADKLGAPGPRQAMAQLDLATCVTVLVNYGEKGIVGPLRAKLANEILGRKRAHRDYWRALERAALVMAGFELASPLGVPVRDMKAAAEDGRTVALDALQVAEMDDRRVKGAG
jgi:hypothetical protein